MNMPTFITGIMKIVNRHAEIEVMIEATFYDATTNVGKETKKRHNITVDGKIPEIVSLIET